MADKARMPTAATCHARVRPPRALALMLLPLAVTACSVKSTPTSQTGAAPASAGVAGVAAGAGGQSATARGGRAARASAKLLADGDRCDSSDACESGHCDQGLCCASGRCCLSDGQCAADASGAATCNNPRTCQGTRSAGVCENFRCETVSDMPDDSGCGSDVVADECGPFRARTCSGASNQTPASCAVTCQSDDECDPEAHCDGRCVMDVADGGVCKRASDCASGHCGNGHCCAQGDCCATPADCAAGARPPRCDDPLNCQGTRVDATCVDFQCGAAEVDDDSGCGPTIRARDCGIARDAMCNAMLEQRVECSLSCTNNDDSQCDPDAHCAEGICRRDGPDGAQCDADSHCESGHCGGGLCCAEDFCCERDSDCPNRVGMCNLALYRCEAPPPPMSSGAAP